MNDQANRTKKPKRRYLQFSLRKLLVITGLICVLLGVAMFFRSRAQQQARIVAEIKAARGNAFYDYQLVDGSPPVTRSMWLTQNQVPLAEPNRLSNWLGVDFFHTIRFVRFNTSVPTNVAKLLPKLHGLEILELERQATLDAESWQHVTKCAQLKRLKFEHIPFELINLQKLSCLESLRIDACDISPAAMHQISNASSLQELSFHDSTRFYGVPTNQLANLAQLRSFTWRWGIVSGGATNDQLAFLGKLSHLERLELNGHKELTDEMIVHIQRLENLKFLDFNAMPFTGKHFDSLASLPDLQELNFGGMPLNDSTFEFMNKATSLEKLHIAATPLTHHGIANLSSLPNLNDIFLSSTACTDEGFHSLAQIESLKRLKIHGQTFSKAARDNFAKRRPNVEIVQY